MDASPASPVISASRRCDLPAFHARWFAKRLRQGFCLVRNPFNPAQVTRVDLAPEAARFFVFWTRNPRPILPVLRELSARGQDFYFLHTLVDYPRVLEPHAPRAAPAVDGFVRLAGEIGPERTIWRYDPIVVSDKTGVDYHLRAFTRLAGQLAGSTRKVVVSLMTPYRKTAARLAALAPLGLSPREPDAAEAARLWTGLAGVARAHGLTIAACAPQSDLAPYGIAANACIDAALIKNLCGLELTAAKDPAQRGTCGCAKSRDIGAYDACLFGCAYCYATSSLARARANFKRSDPLSPFLTG